MCRDEALKVVLDFTASPNLVHVARLLYQLEVLLLQSGTPSKKVCHTFIFLWVMSKLTSVAVAPAILHLLHAAACSRSRSAQAFFLSGPYLHVIAVCRDA